MTWNTYTYQNEIPNLKTTHFKQKCLFVFITLFCLMLIFHFYCDRELLLFDRNTHFFAFQDNARTDELPVDYLIKQNGCRIPAMLTFGPLVEPFVEKIPSVQCDIRMEHYSNSSNQTKLIKVWKPALFVEQNNTLRVEKAALKYYGEKNLRCEYEEFFRSNPSVDDKDIKYPGNKKKVHLYQPTNISLNTEFIRVFCHKAGKRNTRRRRKIYKDFFAFVPLKEDVEKRCLEIERNVTDNGINVMIIALDALSRLNFRRQMTTTSHYLEIEMDGIEMMGYNKVGDNTFPNFIPMFGGQSVDELKKNCWPSSDQFFDNCSFVWQHYEKFGYRTSFAEDSNAIGVFNYLKRGFQKQPTDYYLRPFNIQAELEIGHSKPGNCYLCIGSNLSLALLLDYARKFGEKFASKKYFGLFWSNSFTHDFFNLSPQGDNAVLMFLKRLNRNRLLNNTVLVFVSDHGLRWGAFRETFQGHLEERLPMLWFSFPRWFSSKYSSAVRNLRANANKLTTPFDFYETLIDFANLTRIKNTEIERRIRNGPATRQSSLFLPVSANRTCTEAGIPKHFCTCHNQVKTMKTNDTVVVGGATAIVNYINEMLINNDKCAKLSLVSIEAASEERSSMNEKFDGNTTSADHAAQSSYVIMVKTTPGGGVFEASVRYEAVQRTFLVIGSVSRINTYGKQGNCVSDFILRLYCYCF